MDRLFNFIGIGIGDDGKMFRVVYEHVKCLMVESKRANDSTLSGVMVYGNENVIRKD